MFDAICIFEDVWTWLSLLCGNHLGDAVGYWLRGTLAS